MEDKNIIKCQVIKYDSAFSIAKSRPNLHNLKMF